MTIAIIVFFLSFAGITALFGLRYWEIHAQRFLAPALRERFDARALQAKELLVAARIDLAKLPPALLRLTRIIIHEAALGFAILARIAEKQAHRLADFVSHKHRFEKRETRSEFLKKVSEHRNGNGNGNGQSEGGISAAERDVSAE